MIDPYNLPIANQATIDRGWAWMRDNLDRIQHVALCGAESDTDREVTHRVLMLVVAELYHRSSQRGDDGESTSQSDDDGELHHDL